MSWDPFGSFMVTFSPSKSTRSPAAFPNCLHSLLRKPYLRVIGVVFNKDLDVALLDAHTFDGHELHLKDLIVSLVFELKDAHLELHLLLLRLQVPKAVDGLRDLGVSLLILVPEHCYSNMS